MYLAKIKKHRLLTTAYTDLDTAKGKLEKAEHNISNLLKQQVSPEIALALIQDKPQREEQFVAVMFLDIRGFTPMAEKLNPEQLIQYQNNVFGFMIEIIQRWHGNINQFMGDGFMATFGAPVSHGNDARNAFLAGKEILEELRNKIQKKMIPGTVVGIGIHAGLVVTGNVGTESRKQYSVTGNTVIIAARVEQLNKTYGSQMIITEEVAIHLGNEDLEIIQERHEVKVKGRKMAVNILIVSEVLEVGVRSTQLKS
jgi:adenylate cyclase